MNYLISHGGINIIIAILVIFALISLAQTQEKKTFPYIRSGLNLDYWYSLSANGTITTNLNETGLKYYELLNMRLNSISVTGTNKQTNKTEQIESLCKNFKNSEWIITYENINSYLMTYSGVSILANVDSNGQFIFTFSYPTKPQENYQDIKNEYEIEYNSLYSYDYKYLKKEMSYLKIISAVDYIDVAGGNVNDSIITKNSMKIKGRDNVMGTIYIMHVVNGYKEGLESLTYKTIKDSSNNYIAEMTEFGMVKLSQKETLYSDMQIRPLKAFNLNSKNELILENYYLMNNNLPAITPNQTVETKDNHIHFVTYDWKNYESSIIQSVNIYTKDTKVQNYTRQENLSDPKVWYNLGIGENLISKGDYELVYEFDYFKDIDIDKFTKDYGRYQYFELSFNADFSCEEFWTYASLDAKNEKNENAKIVSFSIKRLKNDGAKIKTTGNLFIIRTTPFKEKATLKFLFKFFDSNKKEIIRESTIENEKIIFKNTGGEVLFTNKTWDINNNMKLEENRFKSIYLKLIGEDFKIEKNGKNETGNIREFSMEGLYYNIQKNENEVKAKSILFDQKANVNLNIKYSFKNNTSINHTFVDEKNEEKITNIILNEKEIYVGFNIENWVGCSERNNSIVDCKGQVADNVYLRFYADKIIHEVEKAQNKTLRLLEEKSNDKNEVKYIDIEFRELKGNYKEFREEKIDVLKDFAETFARYDYKPALKKMTGGFVITYDKISPIHYNESKDWVLYLIIAVIILLIISSVGALLYRRAKLKESLESAKRLNDSSFNY